MQASKIIGQRPPIDETLALALNEEDNGMAALPPPNCACPTKWVNRDRFGDVKVRLYSPFVLLQRVLDFGREERGVNVVEALEQLDQHVVPLRSHRLAGLGLVLGEGLPCHARCVAGLELGEELVSAEEGREVEEVVGVAWCGREVGG